MDLYIEKEFLDNFFIDDSDSPIKNVVRSLFAEYGSKRIFMDVSIDSPEELMYLKQDNPLFAKICDSNTAPPNPINSIEQHLFENSKFDQTLVFVYEKQSWFESAWKKGALCFCFESYKEDIKKIIQDLHFRIDLSQGFNGWESIREVKNLSYNRIDIADRYILQERNIKVNLIPILKSFLGGSTKVRVNILSKPGKTRDTADQIGQAAEDSHRHLNSQFANFPVEFTVFDPTYAKQHEFHDREILTNFSLMECGMGFSLSAVKASNSELRSETIFDKYTYNRHRKIRKMIDGYYSKLERLESIYFIKYP